MVGYVHRIYMLDKGMVHVLHGTEPDGTRFHQAIQNGAQVRTLELFISGIDHLIILNGAWLLVTETVESETADKGGL